MMTIHNFTFSFSGVMFTTCDFPHSCLIIIDSKIVWPTSTPFMEYILLEHHASAYGWKNIESTAKTQDKGMNATTKRICGTSYEMIHI